MIVISSFYRFKPLRPEQVQSLQGQLENHAHATGLRGLILLGPEGINGTISGSQESVLQAQSLISVQFELPMSEIPFKNSEALRHPFHVFKIKIKKEIVTLRRTDLVPTKPTHRHLTPREWHEALKDPSTVVIDTRNDYEVDIGKFKSAIDFRTSEFHEFPEKIDQAGLAKDQKVLIYCTGGIRCEKAILAMEEKGFENVHQLEGGILNYLKEFPDGEFEGECFVFDYRVAVDQNLQPTKKYDLCPHCGQPANQSITCAQCQEPTVICSRCASTGACTCSKNCAHHHQIQSESRKPQVKRKSPLHL